MRSILDLIWNKYSGTLRAAGLFYTLRGADGSWASASKDIPVGILVEGASGSRQGVWAGFTGWALSETRVGRRLVTSTFAASAVMTRILF